MRFYPYKGSTSNILGYIGFNHDKDLQLTGKTGVEKSLNLELKGKAGSTHYEANARGSLKNKVATIPPINGQDVTLTVDIELQQFTQQALKGYQGSVEHKSIYWGYLSHGIHLHTMPICFQPLT